MMKIFKIIPLILLLFTLSAFSQIRVACIGNSITLGASIEHSDSLNYPAQLSRLLGNKWVVKNFGVGGATMLKNGNKPYWEQQKFTQAIKFNPDVVVLKLGTNDSKPKNWQFKEEFLPDYLSMIDTLKSLPSHPVIFICYPVPAYGYVFTIRDSIIKADILPIVKKVSKLRNLEIIDLYKQLSNHEDLFPDKIHPNAKGATLIAEAVSKAILKNEKKIIRSRK